ncbi:Uncharacterised protein [Kluyvera cryocrescens]|uniref:Uncharacterized protein n=1 Tax=Kluyvera cryocrescens TaxID=580 RepID=A0A485ARU2_KLUCR|nr:Uncharacterised protein [Kluyvera cryocrescens]
MADTIVIEKLTVDLPPVVPPKKAIGMNTADSTMAIPTSAP